MGQVPKAHVDTNSGAGSPGQSFGNDLREQSRHVFQATDTEIEREGAISTAEHLSRAREGHQGWVGGRNRAHFAAEQGLLESQIGRRTEYDGFVSRTAT